MNIIQIFNKFPTQESCIKHLEQKRWKEQPICPYCGSENTNPLEKEMRHHCNGCRKSFSVTVGTIFHHTHIPLQKWFLLISLMLNAKKGLSACQAARDIEMRRPTVWSMMHRIRKAMADNGELLTGIVEMDETYVGGKEKNKHKNKKTEGTQGRSTKTKTVVLGMVERDGNIKAQVIEKVNIRTIENAAMNNIAIGSTILSDEWSAYKVLQNFYTHDYVKHNAGEYVRGVVSTNSIESFWAVFKRGIIGVYHSVSKKHTERYLNEFIFRHNLRSQDIGGMFNTILINSKGRLTYKALVTPHAA